MAIVTGIRTISGTTRRDIIVDNQGGNSTITGGAGNDLIYADHDLVFVDTLPGNNARLSALDIDEPARWSRLENPDVGNSAIPYATVVGEGTNTEDWFSVTVGAGQTIILDLDYGMSAVGGDGFDSYLRLLDASNRTVAQNDDSNVLAGGGGSTSAVDSFLRYVAPTAGTYYIEVSRFSQAPIPPGATYVLGVSVTGHANTNLASFGDDSVDGGSGDDLIHGLSGNDTLLGSLGADTLWGGSGNDRMHGDLEGFSDFDSRPNELHGGGGNDTLEGGSSAADLMSGGDGNDVLRFGSGADTASGGAGSDILIATGANIGGRVLNGGGGRDTLDLGEQTFAGTTRIALTAGLLRNGAGVDTLLDIENVRGSQGDDIVNADTGDNDLAGNAGRDMLRGFAGDDTMDGGTGNDTLIGGYGDDLLAGGDGNDSINGQVGEDTINGGNGNDTIFGSYYADTVNGGNGNDVIDGGAVGDVLRGEAGNDAINGVTGNDLLDGGAGDDILRGGSGKDVLRGGTGGDTLAGGDHSDLLLGEDGDDNLQGQDGLDTLTGGAGRDSLIGGGNPDIFVFARGDGQDAVHDFADDEDLLQLDDDLWGGGLSVQQVIDTFAFSNGTSTRLDFGTDDLTLLRLADPQLLADDILIV